MRTYLGFTLTKAKCAFRVISSFPDSMFRGFNRSGSLDLIRGTLGIFETRIRVGGGRLGFCHRVKASASARVHCGCGIGALRGCMGAGGLSAHVRKFNGGSRGRGCVMATRCVSPGTTVCNVHSTGPVCSRHCAVCRRLLRQVGSRVVSRPRIDFGMSTLRLGGVNILARRLGRNSQMFIVCRPLNVSLVSEMLRVISCPRSSGPTRCAFKGFGGGFIDRVTNFRGAGSDISTVLGKRRGLPCDTLSSTMLETARTLSSTVARLVFGRSNVVTHSPEGPGELMLVGSGKVNVDSGKKTSFGRTVATSNFILSTNIVNTLGTGGVSISGLTSVATVLNSIATKAVADTAFGADSGDPCTLIGSSNSLILTNSSGSCSGNKSINVHVSPESFRNGPTVCFVSSCCRSRSNRFAKDTNSKQVALCNSPASPRGGPSLDLCTSNSVRLSTGNSGSFKNVVLESARMAQMVKSLVMTNSGGTIIGSSVKRVIVGTCRATRCCFNSVNHNRIIRNRYMVGVSSLFGRAMGAGVSCRIFLAPCRGNLICISRVRPSCFIMGNSSVGFTCRVGTGQLKCRSIELRGI